MKKILLLTLITCSIANIHCSEQKLQDQAIKHLQKNIEFEEKWIIAASQKEANKLKKKADKLDKKATEGRQRVSALQNTISKIRNNQPYVTSDGNDTFLINGFTIWFSMYKEDKLTDEAQRYNVVFFDQTGKKLATIEDLRKTKNDKESTTGQYINNQLYERQGVVCPLKTLQPSWCKSLLSTEPEKRISIVLGTTDCNVCELLEKQIEK